MFYVVCDAKKVGVDYEGSFRFPTLFLCRTKWEGERPSFEHVNTIYKASVTPIIFKNSVESNIIVSSTTDNHFCIPLPSDAVAVKDISKYSPNHVEEVREWFYEVARDYFKDLI